MTVQKVDHNFEGEMNGTNEENGQEKASDSDDPGPPPPNDRDAMSAMAKKRQRNMEFVKRRIQDCKTIGASSLDLCKRGLTSIPGELLQLSQLQV